MITRLHHVAVVVPDLGRAYGFWREALGLPLLREAEVADQGVRAALLACGPAEVELLAPTTPDTGVARFLARRGGGLHHLCFESDDVDREVERLLRAGVELIDRTPRTGLAGRIAFLHPRAADGILVEVATSGAGGATAPAPLAIAGVRLGTAGREAGAAARRWEGLFGLPPAGEERPERQERRLGEVTLTFEAAGAAPGLTALRLLARDAGALAAALLRAGVAVAGGAEGWAVTPAAAGGVTLSIG